jgi:hypothetical protein
MSVEVVNAIGGWVLLLAIVVVVGVIVVRNL